MPLRYECPSCSENRSEFELLYKMSREIEKDPKSGEEVYRAEELKPDLDSGSSGQVVRCKKCRYTSFEGDFIAKDDG